MWINYEENILGGLLCGVCILVSEESKWENFRRGIYYNLGKGFGVFIIFLGGNV